MPDIKHPTENVCIEMTDTAMHLLINTLEGKNVSPYPDRSSGMLVIADIDRPFMAGYGKKYHIKLKITTHAVSRPVAVEEKP